MWLLYGHQQVHSCSSLGNDTAIWCCLMEFPSLSTLCQQHLRRFWFQMSGSQVLCDSLTLDPRLSVMKFLPIHMGSCLFSQALLGIWSSQTCQFRSNRFTLAYLQQLHKFQQVDNQHQQKILKFHLQCRLHTEEWINVLWPSKSHEQLLLIDSIRWWLLEENQQT